MGLHIVTRHLHPGIKCPPPLSRVRSISGTFQFNDQDALYINFRAVDTTTHSSLTLVYYPPHSASAMWLPLILISLQLVVAARAGKPPPSCLPSGDEHPINDAFARGELRVWRELTARRRGDDGRALPWISTPPLRVCALHRVEAVIDDARRSDGTRPRHVDSARREAVRGDLVRLPPRSGLANASADCQGCDGLTLSNLIVDGNRPQMLRVPGGEALIEMGNAEGHRVTGCRLYEPRGWSALHIREGDRRQCRGAYIGDNVIVSKRYREEELTAGAMWRRVGRGV